MLAVGDSAGGHRGTHLPTAARGREGCCLPGATIRGVTRRGPRLVKSADCSPILIFHVGTEDMVEHKLGKSNQNFRALGRTRKGDGCPGDLALCPARQGQGCRQRAAHRADQGLAATPALWFPWSQDFLYTYSLSGRDGRGFSESRLAD